MPSHPAIWTMGPAWWLVRLHPPICSPTILCYSSLDARGRDAFLEVGRQSPGLLALTLLLWQVREAYRLIHPLRVFLPRMGMKRSNMRLSAVTQKMIAHSSPLFRVNNCGHMFNISICNSSSSKAWLRGISRISVGMILCWFNPFSIYARTRVKNRIYSTHNSISRRVLDPKAK